MNEIIVVGEADRLTHRRTTEGGATESRNAEVLTEGGAGAEIVRIALEGYIRQEGSNEQLPKNNETGTAEL